MSLGFLGNLFFRNVDLAQFKLAFEVVLKNLLGLILNEALVIKRFFKFLCTDQDPFLSVKSIDINGIYIFPSMIMPKGFNYGHSISKPESLIIPVTGITFIF